ncbi:MAG: MSMEG_4193 family putative phosphomutase [Anaerolineae bacterium]
MAIIVLVRHGENDWVKKKRLAGWIPGVHLNENGRKQAEQVAQRLADLPVKAVYSSPVTRCLETAAAIAVLQQLPVIEVAELGEVRYGKWEGKKIKKLARKPSWRAVQFFPSRHRFPQGEALREVQFRAVQALEKLSAAHEKEVIIAVSHADVIKLVLAYYLGVHIDLFQRIAVSPASVSVVALSLNGSVHILRLNDDGPLRIAPPEKKKTHKQTGNIHPDSSDAEVAGNDMALEEMDED